MRKIFVLATMFLLMMSCSAFAAFGSSVKPTPSTGVVIIGGAEFKTPEYYSMIQRTFKSKAGIVCDVGDNFQKKYQRFMIEKYDIGTNMPNKNDLVGFAANSGYNQVIYLVVDENLDTQNNAKTRQKNRISMQLDTYLCDNSSIVDMATTSRDDDSKTSVLRARKGALQKCLEEAIKTLNLKK